MARLTVNDCLPHVKNRFELVLVAAKRARDLSRGGTPLVDWDHDKPTVVALREVAAGVFPSAGSRQDVMTMPTAGSIDAEAAETGALQVEIAVDANHARADDDEAKQG